MSKTISCTLAKTSQAETVLHKLQTEGIPNKDVSVLFPEREDTKRFVQEKHTKAPEGAATGVTTGGVMGGVIGWLVGIGTLAIPGIGPFIAAGPIMAALSGSAIGAAVGGVTGTLVGLGIPEYEAKMYESKLKEGRILVSVRTQDEELEKRNRVMKIFTAADGADLTQKQAA